MVPVRSAALRASVIAVALLAAAPAATARHSSELDRFAALVEGDWVVDLHIAPWPHHPAHDARGSQVWNRARNGLSIAGDLDALSSEGIVAENMTVWWDARAERLRGVWCARYLDEHCAPFMVTWSGDAAVLRGRFTAGGTHYLWRQTITRSGRDSLVQTIDQGEAGDELTRQITIRATRLKLRTSVE